MATVKYECCLGDTIGQSGCAKNRASVVSGRPPIPHLRLVARGWRDGDTNIYRYIHTQLDQKCIYIRFIYKK